MVPKLRLELFAGQSFVAFDVFGAGLFRDIVGQLDTRPGFIKIDILQIIADKLLIEALLVPADLVNIGRPKPLRVRRQNLVNQNNLAVRDSPLKLRIS